MTATSGQTAAVGTYGPGKTGGVVYPNYLQKPRINNGVAATVAMGTSLFPGGLVPEPPKIG